MAFAIEELTTASIHINESVIGLYAQVTGDFNPIHVDPEFAAKTEMGSVIAHGTLSLNLIWQSLELTLGTDVLSRMELDVRFKQPVRIGDVIDASGSLAGDALSYAVFARNQNGVNVIEGTARLLPDS